MDKGIPLENGYNEQADSFWSIYVSEAEQYDSNKTESWKGNMDSTLIFAGLFSATVTSFIIESYKLLQQDSSNVTNLLLTQLLAAQIAAANNNSSVAMPSALPTLAFTPPSSAVAVNILWFLSLTCSLAAALCVTLVQQWVRDYLQRIQRYNQPLRRARVRTFLFHGSEKWRMDIVVKYIPTLLHVSLFLFFAGLYIFLSEITIPVTRGVAAIILFCLCFYSLATLAPLFDPAAPYETPLTALLWRILQQLGGRFAHHCSSQYRQHGPFEPSVASVNLAGAREELALNPVDSAADSLTRDAQAFTWAHDMITNDRELESFIQSIPGFLASEDGRQTWTIAFQQLSSPLEDRISELLMSCSRASYMDPKVRRIRASMCIEALSAISRHHTQDSPNRQPEPSTISHLSRHIKMATKDHDNLPVTNGLCTLALLARQYLLSKFSDRDSLQDIFDNVVKLSQKADEALKDIDDLRQTLEEVLIGLVSDSKDQQKNIGDLLQMYFGVAEAKSQDLLVWVKTIGPILYEYEEPKQHTLLSWYSLLPDVRHFVRYRDVAGLDGAQWGLELYAHQVLAFMKATGAYSSLASGTSQNLLAPLALSPALFPFRRTSTKYVQEYEHLCRELEPISLLLNFLEPNPTKHQVEVRSKKLEAPSIARPSVPYPKKRPILTDHLGPFSTIAFILQDIWNGARVVALLELVMEFKFFSPKIIEPPVIREILDTIFPRQSPKLKEGSQVLLVVVLRVILDWEREASPDKPCAFSDSDITLLVEFWRKSISYQLSLETAERLLGTAFTSDTASERAVPLGGILDMQIPPKISHDARIRAVYNQIMTQRLKR